MVAEASHEPAGWTALCGHQWMFEHPVLPGPVLTQPSESLSGKNVDVIPVHFVGSFMWIAVSYSGLQCLCRGMLCPPAEGPGGPDLGGP